MTDELRAGIMILFGHVLSAIVLFHVFVLSGDQTALLASMANDAMVLIAYFWHAGQGKTLLRGRRSRG